MQCTCYNGTGSNLLDMPFDNTCMQRKLQSDCVPINARGIHQEIGREGEKTLVVSWRMPVALKWILYVFFPQKHSLNCGKSQV